MPGDIQRAIDKQAKLEAEARDGGTLGIPDYDAYVKVCDHLYDQAMLARAVIEAAATPHYSLRLEAALAAWADHVNGETP